MYRELIARFLVIVSLIGLSVLLLDLNFKIKTTSWAKRTSWFLLWASVFLGVFNTYELWSYTERLN